MKFRSFSFSLLAVLLAGTLTLAGCGNDESSSTTEGKSVDSSIAIKVGNESITKSEFNQKLDNRLQRIRQQMKQLPKEKRQKQLERYRQRFKRQLARQQEQQLLLEHFVNQSDVTVSESDVDQQMEQIKKQFPDEQTMEKALKKQGESLDSIRDQIRKRLRMQRYIEQELGEIDVSPEEAQQYFDKNRSEFDEPEQVKARHILIENDTGAKEEIQSIQDQLEGGANFGEVARSKSEGPSAQQGGELGFITRDRMVKPFSDAAFGLDVGELSDPVKTQYGWHLIQVTDRKQASKAQYEDVSDTVVQQVRSQKRRQKTQQLLQDLRSRVEIVNNVVQKRSAQPMPGGGQSGPGGNQPRQPGQ
jgi:parvulin-like peptidyl-prolyl isomerase